MSKNIFKPYTRPQNCSIKKVAIHPHIVTTKSEMQNYRRKDNAKSLIGDHATPNTYYYPHNPNLYSASTILTQ